MTLTETAIFTKRGVVGFIIFILLSIIAWQGYKYYHYHYVYLPSLAQQKPKPNVEFGILPYPKFLPVDVSSSNYSYSIDTPTGSLPTPFPEIIKVFFIPKSSITLLAPDRAKQLAEIFGFENGPEIKTAVEYSFSDNSDGRFLIDLETLNFKFKKSIATSSAEPIEDSQEEVLPDQTQIAQNFKSFLSNVGLMKKDLEGGRSKVTYENNSPKTAQTAAVTLWQDDVEELPIVTPAFSSGLIKATVTKYQSNKYRYSTLEYIYWPIDTNKSATYPLKTVEAAFEDLQSGNGNVVLKPARAEVSISEVYLAYLLPEEYTSYLQPVFVFSGPNFAAFVPAIKDEYLKDYQE